MIRIMVVLAIGGLVAIAQGCGRSRNDWNVREAFYDFYGPKNKSLSRFSSAKFRFLRHEPGSNSLGICSGEISPNHYIVRHLLFNRNAEMEFPQLSNRANDSEFEKLLNVNLPSEIGIGVTDYRNNNYKFGLKNGKIPLSIGVENDQRSRRPTTLEILAPIALRYLGLTFSELRRFPHEFEYFGEPSAEMSQISLFRLSETIELRLKIVESASSHKSSVSGVFHFLFDVNSGLCTGLLFSKDKFKFVQTFDVKNVSAEEWHLRVNTFRNDVDTDGKWQLSERFFAVCEPLSDSRDEECHLSFHGLPEPVFGVNGFRWNFWWTMLTVVVVLTAFTFYWGAKRAKARRR